MATVRESQPPVLCEHCQRLVSWLQQPKLQAGKHSDPNLNHVAISAEPCAFCSFFSELCAHRKSTCPLRRRSLNLALRIAIMLSLCWGSMSSPSSKRRSWIQMLTTRTSQSPTSLYFRDTIAITHELGVRFLWIDSLCIV